MDRIRQNEQSSIIPSYIFVVNDSSEENQSSVSSRIVFGSQTPENEVDIVKSLPSVVVDNPSDTFPSSKNSADSTDNGRAVIPVEVEAMTVLSSMLESEDFETGISNLSEKYFRKLLDKNTIASMNSLSTLFMNNYSVDGRKTNILIGILHILSHLEYLRVYPHGQMMAMCALNHKNKYVAEYGIKCFENWGHPDGIEKLNAVQFAAAWLQEYAQDVIDELTNG